MRVAALLAAWLVCPVPSAAQDALNKRVSLDLKTMAPRDAFNVVATAIGYTADVAPDVSTPVDIVVGNVRARTALDTICDSIGCRWEARGTVIHVMKQAVSGTIVYAGRVEPGDRAADKGARVAELKRRLNQDLPADMKFQNASLSEVADRLSRATGFTVTFVRVDMRTHQRTVESLERQLAAARGKFNPKHPDVLFLERALASARAKAESARPAGTITADLAGRPFQPALATIIEQLGDDVVCQVVLPKDDKTPGALLQVGKPRRPRK